VERKVCQLITTVNIFVCRRFEWLSLAHTVTHVAPGNRAETRIIFNFALRRFDEKISASLKIGIFSFFEHQKSSAAARFRADLV
jgi:hypothetical protein